MTSITFLSITSLEYVSQSLNMRYTAEIVNSTSPELLRTAYYVCSRLLIFEFVSKGVHKNTSWTAVVSPANHPKSVSN